MRIRDRKQNGHIYRRGGWWVVRYRAEVTDGGIQRIVQRAKRLVPADDRHPTEASVRSYAEEVLRPLNAEKRSGLVATTLGEFVQRTYLPYVSDQYRVSTYRGYRNIWRRYLVGCSSWWLRDVRTCEVQRLLQEVAGSNRLSRRTLAHIKAFISGVFNHAKRQGYFDGTNPVHGVAIPKARVSGETYAYSLEEVFYIISALLQPAATIAVVAAFTGLRRGEIQGLLWENYDGNELRVTRSVWLGHVDEPKTPKSKAPVPVIEPLRKALDAYRATCGAPASGVMFSNSVGKPMCLNNLTNREVAPRFQYCKVCGRSRADHDADHDFEHDQARVVWYGWHAFRRGLATNLYRLGVSDKTIQAILRHSNLSTTMNVYVKSVDVDSATAMKRLEKALCQVNIPSQSET